MAVIENISRSTVAEKDSVPGAVIETQRLGDFFGFNPNGPLLFLLIVVSI